MPQPDFPQHEARDGSAHHADHHPSAVQGELPPPGDLLSPVNNEDDHGRFEETRFPPRPSSTSPPISSEDGKEKDVELGQASFARPPTNHERPEEQIGSNRVDWDGPDDPSNPVNWSPSLKWANVAVVSAITFLT